MLAEASTLFALAAEFRKTQAERGEAANADDFRHWLQDAVIPQMLERADQALASVVLLKASQNEKLSEILERLAEIAQAVVPPTTHSRWDSLTEDDRRILSTMYERKLGVDEGQLSSKGPLPEGMSAERVSRSVKFLSEQGWVEVSEYIGGWNANIAVGGLLFVWEVMAPREYRAGVDAVARGLLVEDDSHRVGKIAEQAGIHVLLAHAVLKRWANEGRLRLEEGLWPEGQNFVHSVAESFAREWSSPTDGGSR